MLWDGDQQTVTLSGTSPTVHAFNQHRRPHLSTETAADYLSFFCHHVWGEAGPIRSFVPRRLCGRWTSILRHTILKVPCRKVTRKWRRKWLADALILYGTGLVAAKFEISRSGTVSMSDETTVKENVIANGLRLPRFSRPLRRAPERIDLVANGLTAALVIDHHGRISSGSRANRPISLSRRAPGNRGGQRAGGDGRGGVAASPPRPACTGPWPVVFSRLDPGPGPCRWTLRRVGDRMALSAGEGLRALRRTGADPQFSPRVSARPSDR